MRERLHEAFLSIWSHKLRSALTMLGIIIGIASIIAISSTIMGTNEQIKQNLVGAGNNVVEVKLYKGDYEYMIDYEGIPDGIPVMEEEVLDAISQIPEVKNASFFQKREAYGVITYKGTQIMESGKLLGVDERYSAVQGYVVKSGRDLAALDFIRRNRVVVMDDVAADALFLEEDPIGKVVEVMGEPFVVVGVVERSKQFEPVINTIDDYYMYMYQQGGTAMISDTVWPLLYAYDEPQLLAAQAVNTEAMTQAGKKATDIMNGYVAKDSEVRYKSEDLLEVAKEMQELSNATNQQLIWIAAISLLVGGIGVMNIMLVSVTERTSEIGLRKALGARKRAISLQFLTEAGFLTCFGGVIGVIMGIVLAVVIAGISGVPILISAPVMLLAVVFSFIVGLFFGAIPAVKAAKLNPIDALRRE